jgi:tetratricopeptide (TPR) repeat protein
MNRKKLSKKIVIISVSLLIVIITAAVFIIYYLDYLSQRNARTLILVETYYNQKDYTMAELLAMNMLLDNPDNKEAAEWLERIRAAKVKDDTEAGHTVEKSAGDQAALQSLLAELGRIKAALAALNYKSPERQVVYTTPKQESAAHDTDGAEGMEQDINKLLQDGLAAFENRDYAKATYYFSKAVELSPSHPQANTLLAASMYRENPQDADNLNRALAYCKTAIAVDKHNKLTYMTMGDIHRELGNRELAVNSYLEALNLDPDDALLSYQVGILHYEMGEKEKAVFYLKRALEHKVELPLAYLYLGRIQRNKGNSEQALAYFKRAVSYDKNFYSAYVDMGDCYFEAGDYPAAINSYETAIALKQSLVVRLKKADCLLAVGMSEDAERAYQTALEDHPPRTRWEKDKAALLYHKRALDAFSRGDYALARLLAETGLAAETQQAGFYLVLGKINRAEQEYVQAEAYCRKALAADEGYMEAYLELALVCAEQGKKEEAASVLTRLREKIPAASDTAVYRETQRIIDEM